MIKKILRIIAKHINKVLEKENQVEKSKDEIKRSFIGKRVINVEFTKDNNIKGLVFDDGDKLLIAEGNEPVEFNIKGAKETL